MTRGGPAAFKSARALRVGADPFRCDLVTGEQPFHVALQEGQVAMVDVLLELGQDVNARAYGGVSAAHLLARPAPTPFRVPVCASLALFNATGQYQVTLIAAVGARKSSLWAMAGGKGA